MLLLEGCTSEEEGAMPLFLDARRDFVVGRAPNDYGQDEPGYFRNLGKTTASRIRDYTKDVSTPLRRSTPMLITVVKDSTKVYHNM